VTVSWRLSRRRAPARTALVAEAVTTLALCGLAQAPAAGASARRPRDMTRATQPYWLLRGPGVTAFGSFAGYVWRGKVGSVAGAWTVPRIDGSHPQVGVGATWIGVQTESGGQHRPFIQVGINEERIAGFRVYYAFYSDTKLGFHAHVLFRVHPGDTITARLRLSQRHWHVLIVDHTHARHAAFRTTDDADASFDQAEWLQEDPSAEHRPLPYPQLSTVSFRRLRVDSKVPGIGRLKTSWMSENGTDLAPGPIVHDSFSLAPTQPTAIGLHYLQIAVQFDVALRRVDAQFARWTPQTPASEVASQQAAAAAAYKAFAAGVTGTQWPGRSEALAALMVKRVDAVVAMMNSTPSLTASGLRHWLRAWSRENAAVTAVSIRLRRALALPNLFPLPRGHS
jgi:hypothetical protein